MTTLWSDERITARLDSQTLHLIPQHEAFAAAQEIRADYEVKHSIDLEVLQFNYEKQITALETKIAAQQTLLAESDATIASLRVALARAQADTYIEIGDTSIAVSQFRTGMQDVDSGLRLGSDAAKQRLAAVCDVMATHVMNFGAPNLWPNEADDGPTNWQRLDDRMQMFLNMGVEPMLVLYNYPVWMREIVNADGTVTPCDLSNPFQTQGRVMRDKYAELDTYIYTIAKRYLPYGVRWLVYGNEFKGFYVRRDGQLGWDVEEYTNQYNVFVMAVERAAFDLGLDPDILMLGGPYSAIRTEETASAETVTLGHPLAAKPYGHYRWHGLEAIDHWLQHAIRADFIAWDMGSGNAEGGELVDAFTVAATKYADMAQWVRARTDLPMVITEVYPKTADDNNADPQRIAAAKTIAHLSIIYAGYSMAWQWGAVGQGEGNVPNGGMLRDYADSDPQPWYYAYHLLHDHFTEGANLYRVMVEGIGGEVCAAATDGMLVLVNMADVSCTVAVGADIVELEPFEVYGMAR